MQTALRAALPVTFSTPLVEMADKVPCRGRLCDSSVKFHPLGPNGEPNTKQPVRYGEKACPAFCVPGAKDPLCKGCAVKKEKVGQVKKYSDAVWQGYQGEEIPNWSHIAGSKWNLNASSKHQLAQLKAAAGAAGGGAAVKAVVKKAETVVAAAEKTKAAATAAINRADMQEERALTTATANIVAKLRQKLQTEAANRPPAAAAAAVPAPRAATRKRSSSGDRAAAANIVAKMRERLFAEAATRPAATRKRSSSEKRRRSTARRSSINVQAATNRTASPNMISSPNIANMNSNYSTEGPVSDPRARRLDPVTGRPLSTERVALPAPRFRLPPQPRINSLD